MDLSEYEYSGPIELLEQDIVAFFASRNSTDKARHLALKWAEEIIHTSKIVISGFHSPLEREVLDYILSRNRSVIVALGRGLYSRIPTYLKTAFNEGRVLFISYRHYPRHTQSTAQVRNWAVATLAEEIIFAPFDSGSMLSTLHYTYKTYNSDDKKVKIL